MRAITFTSMVLAAVVAASASAPAPAPAAVPMYPYDLGSGYHPRVRIVAQKSSSNPKHRPWAERAHRREVRRQRALA
jgi:hypothetical protein